MSAAVNFPAPPIADAAARYVAEYGIHIVPLPPRQKRPVAENWGLPRNLLNTPEAAHAHYLANPAKNLGAALGPSRLCSLDIDDAEAFDLICAEFGWSLADLTASNPTTQGQPPGQRIMFRLPSDASLAYHKLTWPKRGGEKGRFTVIELRAADGEQRQDVLPPSIHPDTGQPYVWLTSPEGVGGFHEPPPWLLSLWANWAALKPQLETVCPWEKPKPAKPVQKPTQSMKRGDSVIDAYNAAHEICDALVRYGYTKHGNRWLSPHSSTGLPGVSLLDGNKAFIHHASDPLCSADTGHPVAPFDLFREYEHSGDTRAAVRAAAEQLEMRPAPMESASKIDPETGEIIHANDNAPSRDEVRREQQKAENVRLQQAAIVTLPPAMTVKQMESDCVWIAEGSQVGRISDPQHVLGFNDFAGLTASAKTKFKDEKGREKSISNATLWRESGDRTTVFTRTFQAGADPVCYDPDGRTALNSWRPIKRWPAQTDVALFLDQVAYLFPDAAEREVFLNWLAHLEQRPGELPHYGWLHVAANTGTGRNWLASVLSRVWRGYVAPNVDLPALLDSQFNGQLAGRVLAIVDEVQEAAGDNPYRHTNRLKSLVNAEYRDLNPKFGRQYREHNACRWLVFSNHDNALPLNDTDRRWRVVRHTAAPRSQADYAQLYARLVDREFINAVGVFLAERDISGFNPGERPPMSDAKRAAVAAAKTMTQQYAQQIVTHWPADLLTNADAAELLSGGIEKGFTPAMRRALEELGAVSAGRQIKVAGRPHRFWIIRNHSKWLEADSAWQAREVERARSFPAESAQDVMAATAEIDSRPY